jgi:hypothetical protein
MVAFGWIGMGWQVHHCILVPFIGLRSTRVKNKKEMEDRNDICAIGLSPSSFINGGWRVDERVVEKIE